MTVDRVSGSQTAWQIDYLPARPIPEDGESLNSFIERIGDYNGLKIGQILGRPKVARMAADYEFILLKLADMTRQPVARLAEMTMDDCHDLILAKDGWSAAGWSQYCPCAAPGVHRRDWALALAPICQYCGHLVRMNDNEPVMDGPVPGRILGACSEVLVAAYKSASDPESFARLMALRVDVPWIARRISNSSRDGVLAGEASLHAAAAADLARCGEDLDPTKDVPRSPAVRALAIAAAWDAQKSWPSPHASPGLPPHARPVIQRRSAGEIRDSQVFARLVVRKRERRPEIVPLPRSACRHPRREDLIRLVHGHTQLSVENIPGSYKQGDERLPAQAEEWLWRSRVATLLGQCVLLRNWWSIKDEPLYRVTLDGNLNLKKGNWPKWPTVLFMESDISHAMNLARTLVADGLVDYRARRDALRYHAAVPSAVVDQLPSAAREFEYPDQLAMAWVWCDSTGDHPRTLGAVRELALFDSALNPEGRLTLQNYCTELLTADFDLVRSTQRRSTGDSIRSGSETA